MILTVLFFIIAGFYLAGLFGRLLLGWWIRKKQREFGDGGFARTYTWGSRNASKPKPEGDVTISRAQAAPPKKINQNVGDYVDYEEIK